MSTRKAEQIVQQEIKEVSGTMPVSVTSTSPLGRISSLENPTALELLTGDVRMTQLSKNELGHSTLDNNVEIELVSSEESLSSITTGVLQLITNDNESMNSLYPNMRVSKNLTLLENYNDESSLDEAIFSWNENNRSDSTESIENRHEKSLQKQIRISVAPLVSTFVTSIELQLNNQIQSNNINDVCIVESDNDHEMLDMVGYRIRSNRIELDEHSGIESLEDEIDSQYNNEEKRNSQKWKFLSCNFHSMFNICAQPSNAI